MGTSEQILFTEESLKKAADVLAKMIQQNIRGRTNKRGVPFPKGVDLKETGDFIDSIAGEIVNGMASAVVRDWKAELLEKKYEFLGLHPANVEKLIAKLQPIFAKGAYFASTGPR